MVIGLITDNDETAYREEVSTLTKWCQENHLSLDIDKTKDLEGGKLTSNNVAGSSHNPLQSPAVASGAVSKQGGDAAGQDALHSAGVEGSKDADANSKLPQPSQEEEALMCLLKLKAVYPLLQLGGGFPETEQKTHTHHHRQDSCGAGKQL